MLRKLIEKLIGKRLQNQSILLNFIYLNQLGGLKQQSTTNVDIFLIHLIYSGWAKDLQMSILAFHIA